VSVSRGQHAPRDEREVSACSGGTPAPREDAIAVTAESLTTSAGLRQAWLDVDGTGRVQPPRPKRVSGVKPCHALGRLALRNSLSRSLSK
jgi:hypothetical protein